MPKNQLRFRADRNSGITGNVFFFSVAPALIIMNNARNKWSFPFHALDIDTKKMYGSEWMDRKEYESVCNDIISYVDKNGFTYFKKLKKTITAEAAEFEKYTYNLSSRLDKLSDDKLVDQFNIFFQKYSSHFGLGAVTFLYESILSEWLSKSLFKKNKEAVSLTEQLLKTDYISFMTESEKALLKIKNTKNVKLRDSLINGYLKKYFYIDTGYLYKPAMSEKDILLEVISLSGAENTLSVNTKIKVKLDKREKAMVGVLRETEAIRDQRKLINLVGAYGLCRFLDQVTKRTGLKAALAERAFWFEYKDLIFDTKTITKKLKARKYASVISQNDNFYYLDYNSIIENKSTEASIKKLQGTPAAKGKASGKIRIVIGPKDFKNFKQGDILAAEMTRPDFLPVMRKAKAIVTDEGGLTSHAAIVARELRIPCIVGTKNGTRFFKNGDKVEVDANKGIVRKIK